jgi:hypothetical protein
MSDSIKYGPIFVPGASAIGNADYSCASRNVIAKGAAGSKGKLPGGLPLWCRQLGNGPDCDVRVGTDKSAWRKHDAVEHYQCADLLEARFWITCLSSPQGRSSNVGCVRRKICAAHVLRAADKPATIKGGQSFQLRAPMIEDRAEKEGAQKIKTGAP